MDSFSERGKRVVRRQVVVMILQLMVLAGLILFNLNFTVYKVSGRSMQPVLEDGDMGIASKTYKAINQYDLIIFDNHESQAVKCVAAKEGDNIVYQKGMLYVNGEEKPDLSNPDTDDFLDGIEFQLGPDEYWVIGFNLEPSMSYDSRSHGVVTSDQIKAKLVYPKKEKEVQEEVLYRNRVYGINQGLEEDFGEND